MFLIIAGLVAEVTQPSHGVGYELGRAVAMGKKILCLYRPQPDKSKIQIVYWDHYLSYFINKCVMCTQQNCCYKVILKHTHSRGLVKEEYLMIMLRLFSHFFL